MNLGFHSGEELEQTLLRYVRLYNGQLPQAALKGRTPIEALKDWHSERPELFRKQPYNHPGCDSYSSVDDLEDAIYEYLQQHNMRAKPFVWSKSAEDILTRERRALAALDGIRGNR